MTTNEHHERGPQGALTDEEANRVAFTQVGLAVLLALVLASFLPSLLMTAAVSSFLFWVSLGFAVAAALRGDEWLATRLTGWDKALMLMFVSLLLGLMTDAEAVRDYLNETAGAAR